MINPIPYSRAAIMTRAHAITRAALTAYPTTDGKPTDYRATFRAALVMAWNEANSDPRAEWDSMTGEEQYTALLKMAFHRAARAIAECDRDGNYRPNPYAWTRENDDFRAIAHAAYITMPRALDKLSDRFPLSVILARVCDNAARRTDYAERKHRTVKPRTDEDGQEYIPTMRRPDPIAPDPYAATIARDAIDRAAADETDRDIIALKLRGMNQQEIADRIGMSQRAVSKRIQRMSERYHAVDEYAADIAAYKLRRMLTH